jgi:predicted phage-related endonuclease
MNMKAKKYLELKAEYDALGEQLDKLKSEMQKEMGDNVLFETNKYTFKLPFINRDIINTKAFKEQHPDLFNIFNKTIQYRKFSIAEKGI